MVRIGTDALYSFKVLQRFHWPILLMYIWKSKEYDDLKPGSLDTCTEETHQLTKMKLSRWLTMKKKKQLERKYYIKPEKRQLASKLASLLQRECIKCNYCLKMITYSVAMSNLYERAFFVEIVNDLKLLTISSKSSS